MPVWVCRAGKGGQWASQFETQGVIGLSWGIRADLSGLTRDAITNLVAESVGGGHASKAAVPAGMLWRFIHEVKVGDTVLTPDGETREILIGQFIGEYEFHAKPLVGDFAHYRSVDWKGRRPRDLLSQKTLYSLGSILTLFRFDGAEQAVKTLLAGNAETEPVEPAGSAGASAEGPDSLTEDTAGRGFELIDHAIARLGDNDLESLVAGLLRAMGYHTDQAGEGADGGVDVRAARDPLFTERPLIKVQVKARPDTPMRPDVIRALIGVVHEGERGIFVSTGGFTPAARKEATDRVTLINTEQLRTLHVMYYDRLDDDTRRLLPLRKVWFPARA